MSLSFKRNKLNPGSIKEAADTLPAGFAIFPNPAWLGCATVRYSGGIIP